MSSIAEDWQAMAEDRVRRQYANATAWDHSPRSDNVVLARMRDELCSEFDAFITKIKADAWDEGFDAGELDAMDNLNNDNHECIPNPYQEDE